MKASKVNISKFMKDYVMFDEDGFEYISSKTANEMISTLPRIFENVIVFTEFGKETGLKYLVVRSSKGYANFFYAYISD